MTTGNNCHASTTPPPSSAELLRPRADAAWPSVPTHACRPGALSSPGSHRHGDNHRQTHSKPGRPPHHPAARSLGTRQRAGPRQSGAERPGFEPSPSTGGSSKLGSCLRLGFSI